MIDNAADLWHLLDGLQKANVPLHKIDLPFPLEYEDRIISAEFTLQQQLAELTGQILSLRDGVNRIYQMLQSREGDKNAL